MATNNMGPAEEIRPRVTIGGRVFSTENLPGSSQVQEELGLITAPGLSGQLVHRNTTGGLYETRATITPGGDYLLMFPNGLPHTSYEGEKPWKDIAHYGGQNKKVNDLVAYRSKDTGRTWSGSTVPIDIDYLRLLPTRGEFRD